MDYEEICEDLVACLTVPSVQGKVHPCTGTEALYRPYGP